MNQQQQERFFELKSKFVRKGLSPDEQREFESLVPLAKDESERFSSEKAQLRKQARVVQLLRGVQFAGRVLKDCIANEQALLELPYTMSPEEISSAFAGNPKLANQFIWIDPPASKSDPKILAKDRETLEAAAKTNGNFGASEANLNLLRDILGAGFTEYQINQAIHSNAIRLAPPSQEEKDQWGAEAEEQEQLRLRNLGTSELKEEVSAGFDQRRAAFKQAESRRVMDAKREAEEGAGFPAIPDFYQGKRVDKKFFLQCSRETMRYFLQRFGDAQVTAKIRGLA